MYIPSQKFLSAAAVCFSFFAHAMMYMIIPPTLLDVAIQTSSSYEEASLAVFARETTFMIGSLLFGYLFAQYISLQVGLAVTLFLSGLTTIAIPLLLHVYVFVLLQGIAGLMFAGIYVSATVWMREIGGENAHAYSQAMHASYAIGQMIIPLICAPFLSSVNDVRIFRLHERFPWAFGVKQSDSQLIYPYVISACTAFMAAAFVLLIHGRSKVHGRQSDKLAVEIEKPDGGNQTTVTKDASRGYWLVTILLTCLFMCSYIGMESDTFTFSPQFLVFNDLRIGHHMAALMSSVMSAAFAFVRILSVMFATRSSAEIMLWWNMALTIAGNVILLLYSNGHALHALTWTSLMLLGSGMSSTKAAMNAFVGKRIPMTTAVVGLMVFSGRLSSTANAYFIPLRIESSPLILIQSNLVYLACCCLSLLLFAINDFKFTAIKMRISNG